MPTSPEGVTEAESINPSFWINTGDRLEQLGMHEEAVTCYEKALKCYEKELDMDFDDAQAWYRKAFCLYHLNEYKKALVCVEQAMDLGIQTSDILQLRQTLIKIVEMAVKSPSRILPRLVCLTGIAFCLDGGSKSLTVLDEYYVEHTINLMIIHISKPLPYHCYSWNCNSSWRLSFDDSCLLLGSQAHFELLHDLREIYAAYNLDRSYLHSFVNKLEAFACGQEELNRHAEAEATFRKRSALLVETLPKAAQVFRDKDYRQVVALLAPFELYLGRVDLAKLKYARKRTK